MAGRHSGDLTPSRLGPIAAAVVVVVLVLGGISAVLVGKDGRSHRTTDAASRISHLSAASCSPVEVSLAVAPELAATVRSVLHDAGCTTISVSAAPAGKVVADLGSGAGVPDLWVPDSSTAVARADTGGRTLTTLTASLAASPVVVVERSGTPATSWTAVLQEKGFISGDPLTSTVSAVPLVGASLEGTKAGRSARLVAAALAPVAQAAAGGSAIAGDVSRADRVRDRGGVAVVSEQTALEVGGLRMVAPATGTLVLDYPLVRTANLAGTAAATKAASWLTGELRTASARAALAAAGFRTPDDAPLVGRGAGAIRALTGSTPAVFRTALAGWARISLPTRALAVFDVSGSMGERSGGQTRMELTTSAARAGVALFPGRTQLGVWRFAEHLDGSADYQPMLDVRRLSARVPGEGTQRDALLSTLSGLDFVVGTGTALYDTTLAAFEAAQSSYDPKSANRVIVFTDGRNDDPGSISLATLVRDLRKRESAARPVAVVTIGIGTDADAAALRQIAMATGGTSYVAANPQDITAVFRNAISARGAGTQ